MGGGCIGEVRELWSRACGSCVGFGEYSEVETGELGAACLTGHYVFVFVPQAHCADRGDHRLSSETSELYAPWRTSLKGLS